MTENAINVRKNYFRLGVIVSSLLFITFALGLAFISDQTTRGLFSDIFAPVIEIFVSTVLLWVSIRLASYSKRLAWIWRLFFLAAFSYTLGDITWGIQAHVLHSSPSFSISDIFYLLYYPLIFVSILLIPLEKITLRQKVNRFLDTVIILLVAILGFWNFLIPPAITSSNAFSVYLLVLLAFPIGDLVLLGMAIVMLYSHTLSIPRNCISLFLFGMFVTILSDCLYDFQILRGTYNSGNLVDAGYVISILLFGLASIYQYQTVLDAGKVNRNEARRLSTWFGLLGTLVPSLILFVAYTVLVYSHFTPLKMSFLEIAFIIGALLLLVIFRYGLTLNENMQLAISLKQTLQVKQDQAQTLVDTVQKLEIEIEHRKQVESELTYDALHDRLTGLSNRSLFIDRLNRLIQYNRRGASYPFSIIFMDIDSFKSINDSMGHNTGDHLLLLVGQRLQRILRTSDTLARLGGDEFIIILENTDGNLAALKVVQKIKKELSYPFELEKGRVYITSSIGIVPDISSYQSSEDILRDADIAMYRAKSEGKDRYVIFEELMLNKVITRLDLANSLSKAVENNEFVVYYQPIFEVKGRTIIGFEALARWMHPQRGLLAPDDFLDVAEESGVIVSIDEWILNRACQQMNEWQNQFPALKNLAISVNISDKTLSTPDFVERVIKALESSGLASQSLNLEMTENVLIKDFHIADSIFKSLDQHGVHIQIDDFGSGYSSISYLQKFPIHAMKIDRSFISEMERTQRSQELVSSLILMSQKLGIDCIAEGIETQEQLMKLNQMHCPYGQGFLVSQPLPREAIEKILVNGMDI